MIQPPRPLRRKFTLSLREIAALTGESLSKIKRQSVSNPDALAEKVSMLTGEKPQAKQQQVELTLTESEHKELWLYLHTIFGATGELLSRLDAVAPGSTNAVAAAECLNRVGRCLEFVTQSTPRKVMARAKSSRKHYKDWFAKMDEVGPICDSMA